MKRIFMLGIVIAVSFVLLGFTDGCDGRPENKSAKEEQAATEMNQRGLFTVQPPPSFNLVIGARQFDKTFQVAK